MPGREMVGLKKMLCLALCTLLCLGLAGCTSSAGQNLGRVVEEQNREMKTSNTPHEMKVEFFTDAYFSRVLGFNVVEVANDAVVSPTKYFTIDDWFGQIEFLTADGLVLVLRVAEGGGTDLTTTYNELHNQSDSTRTVGDIEVRTRNAEKGCSMTTWKRDGYQFLLHSNAMQGQPPDADVDAVVLGTRCAAA